MEPNKKIVQKWRSTDFSDDAPDSKLVVILEEVEGGTKVTFDHSEIPDGQGEDLKNGWKEFYLTPMKKYFKKQNTPAIDKAKKSTINKNSKKSSKISQ
jgi:activator of HSP90 ATPase